jgi:hypothetical protein
MIVPAPSGTFRCRSGEQDCSRLGLLARLIITAFPPPLDVGYAGKHWLRTHGLLAHSFEANDTLQRFDRFWTSASGHQLLWGEP